MIQIVMLLSPILQKHTKLSRLNEFLNCLNFSVSSRSKTFVLGTIRLNILDFLKNLVQV